MEKIILLFLERFLYKLLFLKLIPESIIKMQRYQIDLGDNQVTPYKIAGVLIPHVNRLIGGSVDYGYRAGSPLPEGGGQVRLAFTEIHHEGDKRTTKVDYRTVRFLLVAEFSAETVVENPDKNPWYTPTSRFQVITQGEGDADSFEQELTDILTSK